MNGSQESSREIGIEDARKTLGSLVDQVRYTRSPITLTRHGKPAVRITPLPPEDTMTIEYIGWLAIAGRHTPRLTVEDYIGSEHLAEHDIAAIEAEYTAQVDAALPVGVSLHGADFYAPVGESVDHDALHEAIETPDLGDICSRHIRAE